MEILPKMMNSSRNRRTAALALAMAGLWTGALAAQDNVTVGNPQLKDFQLPGQRTTPPAQPQPVPPASTQPVPSASGAVNPGATRSEITDRATVRPTPRPTARTTAPPSATTEQPVSRRTAAPTVPAQAPVATPAPATFAPPAVAQAPTPAPLPAPAAQEAAPPSPFNLNWLWLVVPVLLGLGALLLFRRRRFYAERDEADRGALAGALLAGEAPAPEPVAAIPAEPAPAAPVEEAPRPWLELDIEPDRASATEEAATLHYELVVTNVGNETARNIRIDTRMFNAADEQQIAAFLGGPIHRHSGSPHVTIPPGESMRLGAGIGMKGDEVRAIELQGRRIFVPSVAMNVAYDWGENGEGRSSKSWLVGRKPDDPKARMGAFRLDLGPRIYRSVERRDAKRVMV
jgi:hypothetical protein